MRRALLLLLLASCRTVSNESRPQASPSGQAPLAVVDAAPPPPVETALDWGTRPAADGELFPVIDGMCIHAEVWSTKGSPLLTYGAGTGAFSRGGNTTWGRFVDDGLALDASLTATDGKTKTDELVGNDPSLIVGTWPQPLLLLSQEPGARMRSYDTVWSHANDAWQVLGSHHETGEPFYAKPTIFKGWAIAPRTSPVEGTNDALSTSTIKAWPLEKDAPPLAGIEKLARAGFAISGFETTDTAIYAFGNDTKDDALSPVRWWANGKVNEAALPNGLTFVGKTATELVYLLQNESVYRFEEGEVTKTPINLFLPKGVTIRGKAIAPNGDLWFLTSRNTVFVSHGDALTETPLPAPAVARGPDIAEHSPQTGTFLAGVEVDDPYAMNTGGSVFHFVNNQWREVPLPKPPFATVGTYRAQSIVVPAKGDPFVNVGYPEKGIGWKTAERYRAILRAKRPKEVLRCNEPSLASSTSSGEGFMSFPPIADASCKTPAVILVRLAWDLTTKNPKWKYDKKSDYPSVRDAIKATPSLGATVDLVETNSGNQRYLVAKVPSVNAGKELALATVKHVMGDYLEIRPEVVCGAPKPERVITVDVASGKVK